MTAPDGDFYLDYPTYELSKIHVAMDHAPAEVHCKRCKCEMLFDVHCAETRRAAWVCHVCSRVLVVTWDQKEVTP